MKKNNIIDKKPAVDRLYRLLSNCSLHCLFKIARYLAFILAHSKNQLRIQAEQNIQLCFPSLNKTRRKELVFDSLHHTCCAFFELALLWYRPIDNVLKLIQTETIDERFKNNRGAKIIVAPHHGSWELLNLWLAHQGPLYSLYKPSKSERLNNFIIRNRTRNGAHLVPVNTSGLRSLLKALKNNSSCMILPDQRPAENTAQIEAPFFDYPADTSLLIKKLSSKVECDIYIAAIIRDLVASNYRLKIQPLDREKLISTDADSAGYLNAAIEQFIQNDLSQYQWPYRRFKKTLYSMLDSK